jgi:release factor glutamine methyltransferase
MNLRDELIKSLIDANISSPRLEADIILRHCAPNYPIFTDEEYRKTKEFLARRISHEPIDKIIGIKGFYKHDFIVSKDVLSPRPDTETLVESALELVNKNDKFNIIDLGTGSGCILLSILKECVNATGIGIDISSKALDIAIQNAQKLEVTKRVSFYNKSWLELDKSFGLFDIIVSNPPYIPKNEIDDLDIEVKEYDPRGALTDENDGLDCYRQIANIAPLILKDEGYLLLEVGYNQSEDVCNIFSRNNFKIHKIVPDLSGINRCIILKK